MIRVNAFWASDLPEILPADLQARASTGSFLILLKFANITAACKSKALDQPL